MSVIQFNQERYRPDGPIQPVEGAYSPSDSSARIIIGGNNPSEVESGRFVIAHYSDLAEIKR